MNEVRCGDVAIPAVLHEIDGLAAGVVPGAVLRPVLRVARRNTKVNRLANHADGRRLDDDRLGIDQHWLRKATRIDQSVVAGRADADVHVDVCGKRRRCECDQREEGEKEETSHVTTSESRVSASAVPTPTRSASEKHPSSMYSLQVRDVLAVRQPRLR